MWPYCFAQLNLKTPEDVGKEASQNRLPSALIANALGSIHKVCIHKTVLHLVLELSFSPLKEPCIFLEVPSYGTVSFGGPEWSTQMHFQIFWRTIYSSTLTSFNPVPHQESDPAFPLSQEFIDSYAHF